MKTPITCNTCFTAKSKNKIIATLIGKTGLFVLALCLFTGPAFSQNKAGSDKLHTGIGVFSQVSANGYGTQYAPQVFLKKGRRTCYAGPLIQKRKTNLSGIELNFTYSLTGAEVAQRIQDGYNPNLELFVFIAAAYSNNAALGKHTLREENYTPAEGAQKDLSNTRFRSAELYAGAGLNIRFLKNFKWMNCIGVGGYTSFGFPGEMDLYYDASSLGLILKTGISFDINSFKE